MVVNGVCDNKTKIDAVKLLQYYINITYSEELDIDGHFGPASQIAFNKHKGTITYGELSIWVYILQGLLYCHGYNPNGFDGSYGSGGGTGCLNAVNAYKQDNYIYEYQGTSGKVGVETMASLCWKSSIGQKTFYIRNKSNGRYLDKNSTTNVGLSSYSGSAFQKWQFQFIENGEFKLINVGDSAPTSGDYEYALNAFSSTSVDAQPGNTSLSSQRWTIDGRIDNFRLISKAYNTKALCATSTTAVSLADLTASNVRWELIEASNPYVLPYIDDDSTLNKFNYTNLLRQMNCYSYALGYYAEYDDDGIIDYNDILNMLAKLQPGSISGRNSAFNAIPPSSFQDTQEGDYMKVTINNDGLFAWTNAIIDRVDTDLNTIFEESTSIQRIYPSSLEERLDGPWKKVALVLDDVAYIKSSGDNIDFDYHWYIQHEDGKWSHKRGLTEVTVFDNNQKIIYNPETCNRDYGFSVDYFYDTIDETNYRYFAGYYKIRIDAIYQDGYRDHSEDDY